MIEVGKVLENYIGHDENVKFDMDDSGATLIVCFNNPSDSEIEQFKSGHNFEIRLNTMYDVMMFTVKIGNLNWMDAPYTPHLSKNMTTFNIPADNQGLALSVLFIDGVTGTVKSIRLLGLSNSFTRDVFRSACNIMQNPFDVNMYNLLLGKIYQRYTTKYIVKISTDYCKFN